MKSLLWRWAVPRTPRYYGEKVQDWSGPVGFRIWGSWTRRLCFSLTAAPARSREPSWFLDLPVLRLEFDFWICWYCGGASVCGRFWRHYSQRRWGLDSP